MKLSAKSKLKKRASILIVLGIFFAISSICYCNPYLKAISKENSTDYSDYFTLDRENLKISAVSGKIHIDNNWTAAKVAGICTGEGTYSDPYIIEDLIIDAGGSGSGIWIENSDVYFRIENCIVSNSEMSHPNAGIRLSHINNSQLINNICSSNYYCGISLWYSNNNTLSGNTANDNNMGGINLWSSNNNTLSGNIASNTYSGIYLYNCDNNVISGNNVSNNYYGILLRNSDNNIVSGNTASYNNFTGICLDDSDNNIVSGNIASYNNDFGIWLYGSNNITLSGNTLIGNRECISEEYCQGNTFSDNGDCTYGQGIPIVLIVIISVISGGAVIGVATLLLIIKVKKSRLPKDEVARYKKLKELERKDQRVQDEFPDEKET